MISFFRKVRQQLVGEGRFSKYLFYAVGEIILVVIGILIALQVNNWNMESQKEVALNRYLERLKDDVSEMKRMYSWRTQRAEVNMESATKAITYLQSCQEDSLQKRHLDSTLLSHQVLPNFFLITDTYNEMIDANILSQIEDLPLKNQITEMFTNINESNTFVSYFREDLGRAGTIIWEHVSFRLEEDGTLSVSYDLNTLCRSSEFRNALLEVLDSRQDYWNVMNEILEQIESLEISLASY